jgi:2-polyprenyl-3-methyl-5-hydroxy-6-metoxy-1,4-benzoquinol methylase
MATPTMNRPTPERIFNTLAAFQQTAALKTAIELDIFTAIGDGANKAATLAKKVGAAERGVRILADYLTIQGFLTKEGDRYSLTQESALFLSRKSPASMTSLTGFLAGDWHKGNFEQLTKAVRKGGSVTGEGDNTKPHDEVWVAFARSMAPLTAPAAGFMAQLAGMAEQKPCKILDVAASHGMFGITFAKQNPKAQVVAVDWPAVLEVGKESAKKAGVADRFTALPGSAFKVKLTTGYDFVLLTNILHHFDRPTCEKLLKRMHAALKPGGKAITLDFVPNEDRVSPPTAAAFSLIMLAGTNVGDVYTLSEYEKMYRAAGFGKTTLHQVPDSPQQVLVSEKAE